MSFETTRSVSMSNYRLSTCNATLVEYIIQPRTRLANSYIRHWVIMLCTLIHTTTIFVSGKANVVSTQHSKRVAVKKKIQQETIISRRYRSERESKRGVTFMHTYEPSLTFTFKIRYWSFITI